MKTAINKKKQTAGLLYGLAAGTAYAIFTWGVDCFLLAAANGAFFWVKFVPGLIICLLSGALIGWLTVKIQNTGIAVILWLAQALLFSQLVKWLPIYASPRIIKVFQPILGDFLQYPYYTELNQSIWFGFAVVAIVSILIGLLENILIDQALFSSGTYALIIPLVISFLCFGLAGNTSDSIINRHFREPIQIVNDLIEFAQINADKEIPVEVARSMHLGALNPVKSLISKDRRLILSNFDQSLGHIDVLVDFEGQWVKCTTIYNQVTFCKKVFETPWLRLSGFFQPVLAGQEISIWRNY